jgi:hypothetical protein
MNEDSNYQNRYWRELDQLKVHAIFLQLYLQKTVQIDRSLNMFLAATSSSSICGWAIWQDYSFVWGAIIAGSQLLNAIKLFFPYKKRLKALYGLTPEMEALFLVFENRWFDVAEGKLTIEEIHTLHTELKKKRHFILQKHLGQNPLPEDGKLLKKAESQALTYFENFYSQ